MSISEMYEPGRSWLHRADPRLKLALAVSIAVVLLSYNNVVFMLLALALTVGTLRLAGISGQRLKAIWTILLPVAVLIPVLWPVFYHSGPVLLTWWKLKLTAWAVAQGIAASARVVTLGFLSAAVLLTTDMRALLRGLVHLGLPYQGALTVTISISYIPRIQRTFEQVTEAQMARGFDLSSGGFLGRARARIPVLVAALVSTFRSAETLSRALECRGFGRTDARRTSLYEIHWRPTDTRIAVACGLVIVVLLSIRFATGFGAHPLLPR
jgi:energy-coupling factor transport system permease protein